MSKQKSVIRGAVAGMAGGLAAAWVMNEFIAGPGRKLRRAVQNEAENRQQDAESAEPQDDATMKAADVIVQTATGGRHLSWEEKQKGGPIVHYAFGALMAGLYGALAEYSGTVRSGFGATFGGVLFGGADLIAVPALNLSASSAGQPATALTSPFAAHIVMAPPRS